jgi:hypothetical protein
LVGKERGGLFENLLISRGFGDIRSKVGGVGMDLCTVRHVSLLARNTARGISTMALDAVGCNFPEPMDLKWVDRRR